MIDQSKRRCIIISLLMAIVIAVWIAPSFAHANDLSIASTRKMQSDSDCFTPILLISTSLEISQFVYLTKDYLIFDVQEWTGDSFEHQYYSVPKNGDANPMLFYDSRIDPLLFRWIENFDDNSVTITTTQAIQRITLGAHQEITTLYESTDLESQIRAYGYLGDDMVLFQTEDLDLYQLQLSTGNVSLVANFDIPVEILSNSSTTLVYLKHSSSLYYLELDQGTPHLITDSYRKWGGITDTHIVYFGNDENGVATIFSFSSETFEVQAMSTGLNIDIHFMRGAYRNFFVTSDSIIFDVLSDDEIFEMYTANLDSGERIRIIESQFHPGTGGEMKVSPNEDYLVYVLFFDLYSLSIEENADPVKIGTLTPSYPYFKFGFTDDGSQVTYNNRDGNFRVPLTGGESILIPETYPKFNDYELIVFQSSYGQTAFSLAVQPIGNPDERQQIVQTLHDFPHGTSYMQVPDEASIVYRNFDGEHTDLFKLDIDGTFEPVQLGCTIIGYLRFHRIVMVDDGPMLYFSTQDGLYRLPLN